MHLRFPAYETGELTSSLPRDNFLYYTNFYSFVNTFFWLLVGYSKSNNKYMRLTRSPDLPAISYNTLKINCGMPDQIQTDVNWVAANHLIARPRAYKIWRKERDSNPHWLPRLRFSRPMQCQFCHPSITLFKAK